MEIKFVSPIVEKELGLFVRALEEKFVSHLEKVILYGSQVKGTASESSDIEILVVIDERDAELEDDIIGEAFEITLRYRIYLSLKIISYSEYQKNKDSAVDFWKSIAEESIVLWPRAGDEIAIEEEIEREESLLAREAIIKYRPTLKELPPDQRPRERLSLLGPESLSTTELLAIILRAGSSSESAIALAERLIASYRNLPALARAGIGELSTTKGVGLAKAAQIMAAFELGKRLVAFNEEIRPVISSPEDVVNILMPMMRYLEEEHFKVALLDTKGRLIKINTVSIGSLNSNISHPRECFKEAVKSSSASLIAAHNHPSGDPQPSQEDIEVTKRLRQAGDILGIELLDHIIIGDGRYVSLREKGYIDVTSKLRARR